MKKYLYSILILAAALALGGCKEKGADVRPGIWVDHDLVDAYPGQVINLTAQFSCYTGLKTVQVRCQEWNINETTDLTSQYPVVWNKDYLLSVPSTATFPANLYWIATDRHGTEMRKCITMRYAPCTVAPQILGLTPQIGVDFDTIAQRTSYTLSATLYAEGGLQSAIVRVPDLSYEKTFTLSGTEAQIQATMEFTAINIYPMTIELYDQSDNCAKGQYELIVIPPENPDPVAEYEWLYCFHKGEQPENYIYGFYQYVKKLETGGYTVDVYASSDEDSFFFSPTEEVDGERLFGVSPYVSSRFISKQSTPGYVQGIKPGKGYWTIYVNPQTASWAVYPLDCSSARTEQLYASASWNAWSTTDAMTAGETAYQQISTCTIHTTDQWFCFYTAQTPIDWTCIWRVWYADASKTTIGGWFFAEDGQGDGGTLPVITEDTESIVIFDTATKWCVIKKK